MIAFGPTSHSFFSQRLKLNYVDWGNADAPPLVLVHGGRDHCRNWDWVAETLRHDWHVIAPDLRGHGDSQWTADGNYEMDPFVFDLAQLIHQLELAPVTLVGHSLGGNIALRYTGVYPENVRKLVAIEGLGPSPALLAKRNALPYATRFRKWVDDKREAAGRSPRRYPIFDDALTRMMAANTHLSAEQARHLTVHGALRNEDGTWSWKFDPHLNIWMFLDSNPHDMEALWRSITCPVRMMYGADSWASNPARDGRLAAFNTAEVVEFEKAGHWLHHDQFDAFVAALRDFI